MATTGCWAPVPPPSSATTRWSQQDHAGHLHRMLPPWGPVGARASWCFPGCPRSVLPSGSRPLTAPSLCRTSLPWHGDDFQHSAEPGSKVPRLGAGAGRGGCRQQPAGTGMEARAGVTMLAWRGVWDRGGCAGWALKPRVSAQCFAVRSLGWVEIPEEDLAPGKSSIAVNNCIQQLSNSKGQGSAENRGEVRAWDSAARQGPTLGPLLLRVPVPTDRDRAGGGQGPVPVSTLPTWGIHAMGSDPLGDSARGAWVGCPPTHGNGTWGELGLGTHRGCVPHSWG